MSLPPTTPAMVTWACCCSFLHNMKAKMRSIISCNPSEGISRNSCGAGRKYLLDRESFCRIVAAQHGLYFGFLALREEERTCTYLTRESKWLPRSLEAACEAGRRGCPPPPDTHTDKAEVLTELHAHFFGLSGSPCVWPIV